MAYFSPLNPVPSGISDYSEDLLPSLAHYAQVDLFLTGSQPAPTNSKISGGFVCQPISKFEAHAQSYDAWLFHMGNSAAHTQIYQLLQQHKGNQRNFLVLHDFVLHHFLIGYYLNRGKVQDYVRLMTASYGQAGERVAQQVIHGKLPHALFEFPLSNAAIEAAHAVIVHSQYAANLIRQRHPTTRVGVVRMGVPLLPLVAQKTARARLGLPPDEFVLVSLGHLNPYKRLDSALWAFKSFVREFPNSRYILVGSLSPNYDVKAMIRALGLENKVQVVGFASDTIYNDYLYASDVCVNLRYPTAGETSASLLRIMGAARPVLVSRTGTFNELPDDVCIKVDVDEAEEELLLEYLRLLKRDEALRLQIGWQARHYVATQARLEDAAYDYYEFICQVMELPLEFSRPVAKEDLAQESYPFTTNKSQFALSGEKEISGQETLPTNNILTGQAGLIGEVAQAVLELGIAEEAASLLDVAAALDFVGCGV